MRTTAACISVQRRLRVSSEDIYLLLNVDGELSSSNGRSIKPAVNSARGGGCNKLHRLLGFWRQELHELFISKHNAFGSATLMDVYQCAAQDLGD